MSAHNNRETLENARQKLNAGDIEGYIETLYAPDTVFHFFPPALPQGWEGARQFYGDFVTAFPDVQITFDAVNMRDMSLWERAVADDLIADYPGAHDLDREAAKMFNLSFFDATPDLRFDVQRVIAQGDTVVFQATVSGTFTQPLVTPTETIPPTGKQAQAPFVLIAQEGTRSRRAGRIAAPTGASSRAFRRPTSR